ncbi:bile acid:sodium symporter family protein [Halomonas sp. MC140]|nr:bile acid:sodium symporter family protein [Halomonas sp. MC140]MDN7132789.1 bile acid:sodium symporter family protein [Halomonas sp. MC140]
MSQKADEQRSVRLAVVIFPFIIFFAGMFGMFFPSIALPINPYVIYLLGVVMFTMGLTLTAPDLTAVSKMPRAVIIGCLAQFIIMPLAGWGIGVILQLDPLLIVGMVLLGSSPGGASSNIVAYLARGNVALSITMTSISTLLAPILTPLLVWILAGQYLPIDFWAMFKQVIQMVMIPVLLGMLARYLLRGIIEKMLPYVSWISMTVLAILIAGIMSRTGSVVMGSAVIIFLAVVLHNAFGFSLGYITARLAGLAERERRAIAVEVGMQNAGLAAALANAHYGPLAVLPAAIATIWHNIAGAILAFIFNRFENIFSDRKGSENVSIKIDSK